MPLHKLLDNLKSEINNSTNTSIEVLIKDYDKFNNKRHQKNEAAIQSIQADQRASQGSHDTLRRRQDTLEEQVADMRRTLELASTAPNGEEYRANDGYERQPDPTIIRVNTAQMVSKDAVITMARPWLEPLSLRFQQAWSVSGGPQPLAKSWTIVFAGEPSLAERRVRKALAALRLPDGTYTDLYVLSPDQSSGRAYASADQNLKQLITAQATKKLLAVLKQRYPRLAWFPLKRDGICCIGWEKAVMVLPSPDRQVQIQFNPESEKKFSLDKDAIRAAFETAWAPALAPEVAWSI